MLNFTGHDLPKVDNNHPKNIQYTHPQFINDYNLGKSNVDFDVYNDYGARDPLDYSKGKSPGIFISEKLMEQEIDLNQVNHGKTAADYSARPAQMYVSPFNNNLKNGYEQSYNPATFTSGQFDHYKEYLGKMNNLNENSQKLYDQSSAFWLTNKDHNYYVDTGNGQMSEKLKPYIRSLNLIPVKGADLQRNEQAQKQMIAAASHAIKTNNSHNNQFIVQKASDYMRDQKILQTRLLAEKNNVYTQDILPNQYVPLMTQNKSILRGQPKMDRQQAIKHLEIMRKSLRQKLEKNGLHIPHYFDNQVNTGTSENNFLQMANDTKQALQEILQDQAFQSNTISNGKLDFENKKNINEFIIWMDNQA